MNLWYGKVDDIGVLGPLPEDQPWNDRPPEWILMVDPYPQTRPDRFGDWYARATGVWEWVKYPDPPFNIVFHEGKLKNLDTMAEISIGTLPGDIASRLSVIEALVLPPSE